MIKKNESCVGNTELYVDMHCNVLSTSCMCGVLQNLHPLTNTLTTLLSGYCHAKAVTQCIGPHFLPPPFLSGELSKQHGPWKSQTMSSVPRHPKDMNTEKRILNTWEWWNVRVWSRWWNCYHLKHSSMDTCSLIREWFPPFVYSAWLVQSTDPHWYVA